MPLVIVTEEGNPSMEQGLQSALSYLEEEELADINLNRISLVENQKFAKMKAEEAGRANQK